MPDPDKVKSSDNKLALFIFLIVFVVLGGMAGGMVIRWSSPRCPPCTVPDCSWDPLERQHICETVAKASEGDGIARRLEKLERGAETAEERLEGIILSKKVLNYVFDENEGVWMAMGEDVVSKLKELALRVKWLETAMIAMRRGR